MGRVFGYLLFGAFAMVVCGFDWFVGWCLLACNVLHLWEVLFVYRFLWWPFGVVHCNCLLGLCPFC